jgi:endonuclease-8
VPPAAWVRLRDALPEGDSLHRAANRIGPVLLGRVPEEIAPHRRFAAGRWPERLAGQAVTDVIAHGKHLFLVFEDDLAIHSHLGMVGSWRVDAARGGTPWLTISAGEHTVTQHRGPTLELLTLARRRQLITRLGPDILAHDLDAARAVRRLREDDPTRTVGDALLNQRSVAGIGNMWKAEACWDVALDPWRTLGAVTHDELRAVLDAARARMQAAVAQSSGGHAVYRRDGRPCERCGTAIRVTGQGDDNRATYRCPGCQT